MGYMGFGFDIMNAIFPLFFIFIFGMIVWTFIKGIKQYVYNNKQPIIPVQTKIVAKRYNVSQHHHNNDNNMHHHSSTSYYVTFEMSNGERIELMVPDMDFGMLAEGDEGTLQFQGTRYISFTR